MKYGYASIRVRFSALSAAASRARTLGLRTLITGVSAYASRLNNHSNSDASGERPGRCSLPVMSLNDSRAKESSVLYRPPSCTAMSRASDQLICGSSRAAASDAGYGSAFRQPGRHSSTAAARTGAKPDANRRARRNSTGLT